MINSVLWFLRELNDHYANLVTAAAAIVAFFLAWRTLTYVSGEYEAKYRPYVFTTLEVCPPNHVGNHTLLLKPHNAGSHPAEIHYTDIVLTIGETMYPAQIVDQWFTIGPSGSAFVRSAGYITEGGMQILRNAEVAHLERARATGSTILEQHQTPVKVTFTQQARSLSVEFEETHNATWYIAIQGTDLVASLSSSILVKSRQTGNTSWFPWLTRRGK